MPMIDVTYPEGALDAEGRNRLVDGLTTTLLRAERAPDTQFFRDITWVYVHELPAQNVYAGAKPVEAPTFRVMVTTPQGALSDRRREELVQGANELIKEIAGIEGDSTMNVWVLCREIEEGSWGAGGNVIRFEQLREAAKAQREATAEAVPAG
jgi:phenylpyruvate tautomerase PptA (4-oxalocrotonate tautomerase family)